MIKRFLHLKFFPQTNSLTDIWDYRSSFARALKLGHTGSTYSTWLIQSLWHLLALNIQLAGVKKFGVVTPEGSMMMMWVNNWCNVTNNQDNKGKCCRFC